MSPSGVTSICGSFAPSVVVPSGDESGSVCFAEASFSRGGCDSGTAFVVDGDCDSECSLVFGTSKWKADISNNR